MKTDYSFLTKSQKEEIKDFVIRNFDLIIQENKKKCSSIKLNNARTICGNTYEDLIKKFKDEGK